jgi:hypothetical protein
MKILQVASRFYPRAGGVEKHVFFLLRELANIGHDVTAVTSNSVLRMTCRASLRCTKEFCPDENMHLRRL